MSYAIICNGVRTITEGTFSQAKKEAIRLLKRHGHSVQIYKVSWVGTNPIGFQWVQGELLFSTTER